MKCGKKKRSRLRKGSKRKRASWVIDYKKDELEWKLDEEKMIRSGVDGRGGNERRSEGCNEMTTKRR